MITKTDKDLLISAQGVGKEVSFVPALKEQGAILKRAARQGYYYPAMALKQLNALSTGLNGKRNVFIPNINDFKSNTFQKVVVFVPGIKATVERRPNDTLVVTQLYLDPNESYMSIARGSNAKPGVYNVRSSSDGVRLDYKNNGRITPENNRNVVISDTEYSTPEKAAINAAMKLEKIFGSDAALRGDFEMFYSPVGSRLGGMLNYNPTMLNQSYGFAGLLADAIEKSKSQDGIVWASELGGSVVLTQGLQVLANKGVSFKGKNHIVKMYKPTTDPAPTLTATKQLEMYADKKLAQGNGGLRASASSMLTNASRAIDRNDPYSWKDYAGDIANGTSTTAGAVGALSLGATIFVNSPILTTVGTVAGSVGALQFAINTVKNRLK